jgi:hypothetical protein
MLQNNKEYKEKQEDFLACMLEDIEKRVGSVLIGNDTPEQFLAKLKNLKGELELYARDIKYQCDYEDFKELSN